MRRQFLAPLRDRAPRASRSHIRAARAAAAILALVGARARRRRSAAALVALSVAGSIVVLGSLLGVGIVTEDLATRRALSDLAPPDRLIGVQRSNQDGFEDVTNEQAAHEALQPVLDITEPIVAVRMYQPPREPFRVLAMDGSAEWAELTQGRLPVACAGRSPCEALRIGPTALPSGVGEVGTSVELGDLHLDIVGVATPSPNLPLAVISPDGLALLIEGRIGINESPEVRAVPRTGFWLAPIDPEAVHSWTLAGLASRVDEVERVLAPYGRSFLLKTPENTLAGVHQRTQVAIGRLVFISSLIVGVLLAFAAFAAAIERSDVALEDRRLRAAGASRAARLLFVSAEAILPAIAGAIVGFAGAAAAVAILASAQAAPVDVVLGLALLQPAALALTFGLVALAVIAVILGIHPGAGRLLQPRVVAAAVVPAGLILAWQRLTAGPSDAAALAAEATSPASVLLPGALGLAVILGSLALLPPLLRGLARISRRGPIGIRLAAISVAREPLRPAAVMTLLAFSVGAVVFGQVYSATLRQGAVDQSSFATGMDLRVQSLAAEGRFSRQVLPSLLRGDLGTDLDIQPMARESGETASRRTFILVGVDGLAIPRLEGWRNDFSGQAQAALATAIDLPGAWELARQPLADGVRTVSIDVDYDGAPIRLSMIVAAADGSVQYIPLGELAPGTATMSGNLFTQVELEGLPADEPKGWSILGLLAANGGPAGGGGAEQGHRQEGDLTIRGLESLVDPSIPVHVIVSGEGGQLIRPPVPTDGLVLPALVSPELAGDVDAAGEMTARIGSSLDLRIKPVGVITEFPTIVDRDRLVVVDLQPLLLSMNAHDPGTGVPNQVLIGTPGDARTAELASALARDPFPPLVIQSRPASVEARANDPFALGIVWGLAVGAGAGLLLSILGVLLAAAAELRDERGELYELEAQGSTPRALTGLVVLRTIAMCAVGTVTGILVGIGLGWVVASSIGVGGEGATAVPALVLVAPLPPILALAAALLLLLGVAVWLLTRRHFARPSLGADVR
ncbi:MAG TPA: FtsX-like permease family protein [Candidatus Limnocylindria bacterium]|nr:FtsX-like permease family protein [Candidatus Limnocylindria bacterium]